MSNGKCSKYNSDYCDSVTCGEGDGGCDSNCPSNLVCGTNNFIEYHPALASCAETSEAKVCSKPGKIKISWRKDINSVMIHLCLVKRCDDKNVVSSL